MEKAISKDFMVNGKAPLGITSVGRSDTMSGHRYGPAVRPYYLIHYIIAGSGTYTVNRISYHLHAGQGFLIAPNYRTVYEADQDTPWSYVWLGFSGTSANQLVDQLLISASNPVFSNCHSFELADCVNNILHLKDGSTGSNLLALSYLLRFLSFVAQSAIDKHNVRPAQQNQYVNQAIMYLKENITTATVDVLAKEVNLDRSYLSNLFKKDLDLTPQEYIRNFRITKARHLLESSELTIEQIADLCGYRRASSFTRTFKQAYGLTPREYRKQHLI